MVQKYKLQNINVSIIPLVKKFSNMVNESDFENSILYHIIDWRLILNTKNDRFNNKMSFETLIK